MSLVNTSWVEDNLSKIKSPYVLLPSVNFSIDHGEMVAIMGSSGCGKSTLLNILGLIDSPSDGEYFFNGTDIFTSHLTFTTFASPKMEKCTTSPGRK